MPHAGPPVGLYVCVNPAVVATAAQPSPEPDTCCCSSYTDAPATALQVAVNVPSARDTPSPTGAGGASSATSVTSISTVVVATPSRSSLASTISVYEGALSWSRAPATVTSPVLMAMANLPAELPEVMA